MLTFKCWLMPWPWGSKLRFLRQKGRLMIVIQHLSFKSRTLLAAALGSLFSKAVNDFQTWEAITLTKRICHLQQKADMPYLSRLWFFGEKVSKWAERKPLLDYRQSLPYYCTFMHFSYLRERKTEKRRCYGRNEHSKTCEGKAAASFRFHKMSKC